MKMRRFLIAPALAGILLVSTSCSNPFAPTATSEEAAATVAPEVKTAVEEFLGKYNAHEAEGAGEYLADDPGFQWLVQASRRSSPASAVRAWKLMTSRS
jgi:hypothetical protein